MEAPGIGACCSNQLLVKTPPATPYSFTTQVLANSEWGSSGGQTGHNEGLTIRDSNTGKFVTLEVYSAMNTGGCSNATVSVVGGVGTVAPGFPCIRFEWWTNPTTDNATKAFVNVMAHGPIGLKIKDDGTNIISYFSLDGGMTWVQLYSESRTAFLAAPDQVGFVQPRLEHVGNRRVRRFLRLYARKLKI